MSLDFDSADSSFRIEPIDSARTPDQLYDQQWAITLLNRTMEKLESELQATGKAKQFRELKHFIIGDSAGDTYRQAGERLALSESAAKKAASRIRHRYRTLLREEISQTVSSETEIDDEIRCLFLALGP